MNGPCAKTTVKCTIISPSGSWTGTNACRNPQPTCPRGPGEGYEKCKSICDQIGHAEIVALQAAGESARGGVAWVEYFYVCGSCQKALDEAGVRVSIGAPR